MSPTADNLETQLIALLRQMEEAKTRDLDLVRRLFARFRQELETQIAHEEAILFPPLDTEANGAAGELTEVMRVEHRQIRRLLGDIEEKLFREDSRTGAEQIVLEELLRKHRRQERAVLAFTAQA